VTGLAFNAPSDPISHLDVLAVTAADEDSHVGDIYPPAAKRPDCGTKHSLAGQTSDDCSRQYAIAGSPHYDHSPIGNYEYQPLVPQGEEDKATGVWETSDIGVEPGLRRNNDLHRFSGLKQLVDSRPPPFSLPFSTLRIRHTFTIAIGGQGASREVARRNDGSAGGVISTLSTRPT